jgi:Ser/Thr protein kinase RdoA (MazF antagonist)
MQTFPASSSILSASYLATFLAEKYDFNKTIECRLLKAGINHTYLVTNGDDKFIFRVYSLNWRSAEEISAEIKLLNHLRDHDIPVSYAICDEKGTYIQQVAAPEGMRYGVLFSHAGGRKMISLTNEMHFSVGQIMAGIHSNTKNYPLQRITYTPEVLVVQPLDYISQYLPADTEEMKFMASVQVYLIDALKKVDVTKVRSGTVHLDIWFDNLAVNSANEITLFDFDFCGNGWVCLDIAYHLMELYFLEPDLQVHNAKKESFLKGYETVVKITEEEKRILPLLGTSLYLYYLGVQCSRFENWSNVFVNEVYLSRYIMTRVKKQFDLVDRT